MSSQFNFQKFEAQIIYFCLEKEKATPPWLQNTSCMQKTELQLQATLGFAKPRYGVGLSSMPNFVSTES
uniref:Putative ovule protein n=1 Tax=Solanum chacoense TaxID=4108 RepID=A0A0V0HQX2_SOLCH